MAGGDSGAETMWGNSGRMGEVSDQRLCQRLELMAAGLAQTSFHPFPEVCG